MFPGIDKREEAHHITLQSCDPPLLQLTRANGPHQRRRQILDYQPRRDRSRNGKHREGGWGEEEEEDGGSEERRKEEKKRKQKREEVEENDRKIIKMLQ